MKLRGCHICESIYDGPVPEADAEQVFIHSLHFQAPAEQQSCLCLFSTITLGSSRGSDVIGEMSLLEFRLISTVMSLKKNFFFQWSFFKKLEEEVQ